MKKLIAILMIVALLVCMMSVVAFADDVKSPEQEEPSPVPGPVAPQTGVSENIGLLITLAIAALCGAVVAFRKASA